MKDKEEKKEKNPEWIKVDPSTIKGLDERIIIRFYRFNKNQWKFWIGVAVTVLIVVFVIK